MPPKSEAQLRVYLLIEDLQRQFAAYMGTPLWARGYPPLQGEHSLLIEVSPALLIQRVLDLAVKAVPSVDTGVLMVERQFGVLELHSRDLAELKAAGQAVLDGLDASADDQLTPTILYFDIIEDISDQHAIIINRARTASMILPGESLLVYEMTPALFAAVAANEAERAAPGITVVDVQMIGATGRVSLSGPTDAITLARDRITEALAAISGKD